MRCYVIILNYLNWRDTIECLDSVFLSNDSDYRVVVVDNNSPNESIEKIREWSIDRSDKKELNYKILQNKCLAKLPIITYWNEPKNEKFITPMLLVKARKNSGFASGNNIGINIAINQGDCDVLFILNNDTIIKKDTIKYGVNLVRSDSNIGICSTNVRDYYNPKKSGWKDSCFVPWIGMDCTSKKLLKNRNYLHKYTGCGFFVTRKFVEKIGLMEEKYFLYYEELDWSARAKGKFKIVRADNSIIFHKESKSADPKSQLSQFCTIRSQYIFMKKFYCKYIWFYFLVWIFRGIKRICEGRWSETLLLYKTLCMLFIKGDEYHGEFF